MFLAQLTAVSLCCKKDHKTRGRAVAQLSDPRVMTQTRDGLMYFTVDLAGKPNAGNPDPQPAGSRQGGALLLAKTFLSKRRVVKHDSSLGHDSCSIGQCVRSVLQLSSQVLNC
jgi:hypothetical protein